MLTTEWRGMLHMLEGHAIMTLPKSVTEAGEKLGPLLWLNYPGLVFKLEAFCLALGTLVWKRKI